MKKSLWIVATLTIALVIVACGKKEEAPAEPATEEVAAPVATPAPAPVATPAADPAKEPNMEEMGKALNALAAASKATPEGNTPCERAYNSAKAMIDAMGGDKAGKFPTKDNFSKACGMLPEMMQNCMSMQYAMGHQEECQKASKEVDPKIMEEVKALMGK